MLLDDDDILHDHPYVSLSLVLTDGLSEYYQDSPPNGEKVVRVIAQGALVYRSSRFAHQLIVNRQAWTLFLTGPRIKEWGFWCPRGWKPWQQYVSAKQDPSVRGNGVGSGTSGIGVGCGEQS
jgi:hypothetical protein